MNFNSLWIGKRLSKLEILAIKSHVKVGHNFVLWVYDDVEGIPDGITVKDAREILTEDHVFSYARGEGIGSYSACSNLFRYKLLLDQGGWWVDTDVVALKPFEFDEEFVFASENLKNKSCCPTTCVIKAPAGSKPMWFCWEKASKVDRLNVKWGTIGPKLISKAVFKYDLEEFAVPPYVFCPVDWFVAEDNPVVPDCDTSRSHAVHLWHEMWRRNGIDKDADFDPNSLYERLKHDILRPRGGD